MTRRPTLLLAAVLGVVGIVASAVGSSLDGTDRLWPLTWLAWPIAGSAIVWQRPGNRVGVAVLLVGSLWGLSFALLELVVAIRETELARWLEMIQAAISVIPWLAILWLLTIFPTGHQHGRPEQRIGTGIVVLGVVAVISFLVSSEPMYETGEPSPLAVPALEPVANFFTYGPGFLLVVLVGLASLSRLVVRWRRSVGAERAQFQWFLLGSGVFVLILGLGFSGILPESVMAIWLVGGWAIPTSIAVAVNRYRLFEIDRIVSRTVSYALVIGLLAAVFAGVVAALTTLVPSQNSVAVAGATLAAAALFSPVRRRIQYSVDRRFNRARYDAERTIAELSNRLRAEVEVGGVASSVLDAARRSLQPAASEMWLRPPVLDSREAT